MSIQAGSKSFERHLKRYVHAPEHRFLVAVPRELFPVCREELARAGIARPVEMEAGLEFDGRLDKAYLCNLMLRTAGRVLLRLPYFRAGAPEELFHKAAQIRWELWLNPEIPVQIEVHAAQSRIESEGLAAEKVFSGIQRRFRDAGSGVSPEVEAGTEGTAGAPPQTTQRILVHLVKNQCRISLDTTGPHLHERGYRPLHAGAPLRETLAAAILLKSGWDGGTPLVDGMCGSGTIAIEAALIARNIPPGANREFLFQRWPSFRKSTWDYMWSEAAKDSSPRLAFPIHAADVSGEALAIARENGARAGVAGDIVWREGDFFDLMPGEHGIEPGLLVLNPPYGKRQSGGGKFFFARLGAHIRERYRGWKYAVIAPSRASAVSLSLPSVRLWKIRHGGLEVTVAMGQV